MKHEFAVTYSNSSGHVFDVLLTARQYRALKIAHRAGLYRILEVWILSDLIEFVGEVVA